LLKTVLSWLRGPQPESPAVASARKTGRVLEWWLVGFGERGAVVANDARVLEEAMTLREEGRSEAAVVAHLANVLVGDLILAHPRDVRDEVRLYMARPDVSRQLMSIKSSEVVMLPDTLGGFAIGTPAENVPLRLRISAEVLERTKAPGLSPAAHALCAGVRHAWERSLVALAGEKDNDELKRLVGRLMQETIFALDGDDADTRQRRHFEAIMEQTLLSKPDGPENSDA
jgi:hypothetical protein